MNVYEVVSETLERGGNFHGFDPEPPEYCRDAAMVVARSPSQAKYAVCKAEASYLCRDLTDMPKFSVRIVKRNVDGECRIVSEDPDFALCWGNYGQSSRAKTDVLSPCDTEAYQPMGLK